MTQPAAAAAPALQGCIERITADAVSGWLVDRANVTRRPRVRLLVDGVVIAEAVADGFRQDLLRNNVGDGRHGFHLSLADPPHDLAAAFLADRLVVEAFGGSDAPWPVGPSRTLARETRDSVLGRSLDTLGFAAFLQEVEAARRSLPAEDVARLVFPLVNAGRAHFPEWRHSRAFLDLASEVSRAAGKPLSEAHYRARRDAPDVTAPSPAPAQLPDQPLAYGTLADLVAEGDRPAIRLVRARMFRASSPPSFLEETGVFAAPQDGEAAAVPVLAFREYAFGAPTWHVLREGRRHDVARSLYYLDFEQVLEVIRDNGIICIDMSNEGPRFYAHGNTLLNAAIDDIGLPRARVLYVTQNLAYRTPPGEREFCGAIAHAHFYIGIGLRWLGAEFPSLSAMTRHVEDMVRSRRAQADAELRYYACLNFTPRAHRWLMALFLLDRNHLDRGFVSFPGATNLKLPHREDLSRHFPMVRDRERLLARIPDLLAMCPLVLDVAPDTRDTPTEVFPLAQMRRSLFQIVTESEVAGDDIRRVTEKILKPIVGLQPFVVMGNAGSLDILRRMGFRGFAPVLREGYDDIVDPAARIDAVFDEVDRLMAMPLGVLRAQLQALDEVVIHNFLHLVERGPLLFGTAAEARLRRTIARMLRAA